MLSKPVSLRALPSPTNSISSLSVESIIKLANRLVSLVHINKRERKCSDRPHPV